MVAWLWLLGRGFQERKGWMGEDWERMDGNLGQVDGWQPQTSDFSG